MLGFPLPYRDELLYSTIARYGVHSGIVSPKELLQDVYGDTRVIATSDLPSHLKRIAALYPGEVGITPVSLLYRHTLFPLYAPFVGETRRRALMLELIADGKSAVHLTAGVAASRVKQPEYLRYCPECIEQHVRELGECYWRRDWQVAGIDSCPTHGSLFDSQIRRHDAHRHQFTAANADICLKVKQQPGCWQSILMVQSVSELLNLSEIAAPELLQWSYWYKNLAADHQLNRGTQVRHEHVRDKVIGFWGENWLSRCGLLSSDLDMNWLKNMFRKHRKAFSYLEHLVVLHVFMKRGWKLADVFGMATRFKPEVKIPVKMLKGTDASQISEYRSRWLAAVEKLGTKQARLNGFGDVYAWLYRRDRNWLMEVNRHHKLPQPKHEAKVDWHKRDTDTVKALIALRDDSELYLEDSRHSKNWYLNQLKHKAGIEKHLNLLPLCRLFFDRYCESIFEYQIRRMTRSVIRIMRGGKSLKRWQVLRWSGLSEERLAEPARRFLKEILGV
jgi:hypothetical protein